MRMAIAIGPFWAFCGGRPSLADSRPMKIPHRRIAFVASTATALGCILIPARALGQELFEIDVTGGGGSPQVTAGGSSLPDLIENVIRAENQFAAFDGVSFTSSLDYAGVANAIQLDADAAGTSVTLTFPTTGFTQTFTGGNRDAVEQQIEDFLKEDGLSAYSDFLASVRETSLVNELDGNPFSNTAQMARSAFDRHGLGRAGGWRSMGADDIEAGGAETFFAVRPTARFADAGNFSASQYGVEMTSGVGITSNIGFNASGLVSYTDLEGASIFHLGGELALPITVVETAPIGGSEAGTRMSARITPLLSLSGSGSEDTASGGLLWGVGIAGTTEFVWDALSLVLGAQIVHYESLSLEYDSYEFDPKLEQTLVTLGGLVRYQSADSLLFVDGGLSYYTYLEDAAVNDWIQPTVGVGIQDENHSFRLAYQGDFGSDFDSHGITANWRIDF